MAVRKMLRVGAFQFEGSAEIGRNLTAILRGLRQAACQKVRLLALQECALTGYAGVDRDTSQTIDRRELARATEAIRIAARARRVAVALGTTVFRKGRAFNAVQLIGLDGRIRGTYCKRALYGEDKRHYAAGEGAHLYTVAGIRVGLRICFEFRFPEYFRELLAGGGQLAVMGFSMVGPTAAKRSLARALLMSRASENGLWILAANNTNGVQNAPTCLVDPDGRLVAEAPADREALISGAVTIERRSPLRRSILAQARSLQARRNRPRRI